jgi:two-component system sensor histidine kinase AlgZ
MPNTTPTEHDTAAPGAAAASLWPSTAPLRDAPSADALTRFDPLAEERARLQAQAVAAFDVCHPALALRAVLLVQAVLVAVALAGAASMADWGARQGALAFGGLAGTLLWLVVVCALKRPLRAAPTVLRAAIVLSLGAAAALLAWWPLAWAGLANAPDGATGLRLTGLALAGAGFAALLWAWLDLRARIWHPANAAARLAELQSRIRPHFLFNALNTALALVRADPEKAERVLEDLSELFRVALAEAGASVSLEEEVELARRYLDIEAVRYGARLAVHWDVDPRANAARIPPLVLQPLVENAVRHGIEPSAAGGHVTVCTAVQRGQVVVTVSNTVGDEPGSPGHGMALHNLRERLRLLHDVAAQCDVWRSGDQFHARIVLPL